MKFYPLLEWLDVQQRNSRQNDAIQRELLQVRILIETALDKLGNLGFTDVEPVIRIMDKMGAEAVSLKNDITNQERVRLLMIQDFMKKMRRPATISDIARYKTLNPTTDDINNEGRIINSLETKRALIIDRSAGSKLGDEPLELTDIGKAIIEETVGDLDLLRVIYNRSRSNKIREFLIKYLDYAQRDDHRSIS